MTRILQITILFIITIAVMVSMLPFLLSTDTMREHITKQISTITNGKVSFQSDPSISFNPFLGIEISNLKIQDSLSSESEENLLTVETVKAKLDMFPALLGQIRISEYQLIRPKLNLKIYTDGKKNWDPKDTKIGNILESWKEKNLNTEDEQHQAEYLAIGQFGIIDGEITYEDLIAGEQNEITGIDGNLNWPSTTTEANFNGVAIWQGEILQSKLFLKDPLHMMAGGQSEIALELLSNPLNLTFNGHVNMIASLFLTGEAEFTTPSFQRISEYLELELGRFINLGNVMASGQIEATTETIKLTDANIKINENSAKGVIILTKDELENITLDGTLAFEEIIAEDYLQWSLEANTDTQPKVVGSNFSADLRISSNSFISGPLNLKQVAANISTDGNAWTFDISDALIFDGQIIAQLGERKIQDKFQSFIDISARNIDTEALLSLLPDNKISLSGASTFKANLTTNYNIDGNFLQRLNGKVSLKMGQGTITGLDIPTLLRLDPDTPDEQYEINDGSITSFESLNSKFFVQNGLAYINATTIKESKNLVQLNGNINLYNDAWVLRVSSNTEDTKPIIIGGTVKAPLLLYTHEYNINTPPEAQVEIPKDDASN